MPFRPPNVAGWPSTQDWLAPSVAMARAAVSSQAPALDAIAGAALLTGYFVAKGGFQYAGYALYAVAYAVGGWEATRDGVKHMAGLSLLVMPSRYEGLPIALVEAMLCSRPAVVTDVGGTKRTIVDAAAALPSTLTASIVPSGAVASTARPGASRR